MGKWEMVRLGDVCEIVSGTTPKSNVEEYWNGTENWVTPAELKEDTLEVFETDRKITELAIKGSSLKSFPAGTVLLSSRAPIGKIAIAGTVMYCNQGFKNFICSEQIFNKFLYWFLKGKTDYLNSLGRGATFKEISKSIVQAIEVPLPPLDEQKRIAKNLDLASEIVKGYKEQLAELDKLVKSVFYEMFGDPVTNEKGWAIEPLSKTARIVTGNTPPRSCKDNYGYHVEWIKTDNITDALYVTQASEYLSEGGVAIGRLVDADAILMACIAGSIKSIGRVAIANRVVAFNQQINAVITKKYDTLFLYWLFKMTQGYIQSTINMSLKGILSKGKLEKLVFIVPPRPLQTRFAKIVTEIQAQKAQIQQALTEAENLFNSLMQEYFE